MVREPAGQGVSGRGRCGYEVTEGQYKEAFEYALEGVIGDPKKLEKRWSKAGWN